MRHWSTNVPSELYDCIAFAVDKVQCCPTRRYWVSALTILRYLQGTPKTLVYGSWRTKSQPWWGMWMLDPHKRQIPDWFHISLCLRNQFMEICEADHGCHIIQPLRDKCPVWSHMRMCLAQMDDRPHPEVMWPELGQLPHHYLWR
jgi:hypothetical protein